MNTVAYFDARGWSHRTQEMEWAGTGTAEAIEAASLEPDGFVGYADLSVSIQGWASGPMHKNMQRR